MTLIDSEQEAIRSLNWRENDELHRAKVPLGKEPNAEQAKTVKKALRALITINCSTRLSEAVMASSDHPFDVLSRMDATEKGADYLAMWEATFKPHKMMCRLIPS